MFLEAFQDHPRMQGRAFEGGEEFVLRRVRQLPPQRDTAQFGVHQHRSVSVIPGEPQEAGLSGAVASSPRESAVTLAPARFAIASQMSPLAPNPASIPYMSGWIEPYAAPQVPGMGVVFLASAMMGAEVPENGHHVAFSNSGAERVPMPVQTSH